LAEVVLGLLLMAVGAFHIWARRGLSETYANSVYRWIGLARARSVVLLGAALMGVGLIMLLGVLFR
jgi:hypothetical protein